MFWIEPLIEFGGQERYDYRSFDNVHRGRYGHLVGMDCDGLKKRLDSYPKIWDTIN